MRSHTKTSPNLRRQLAGWGGLLLYVLALSPVGLVFMGILGTLDADHHAMLQSDADGIRLVLRHEGGCARHQHHAVARVLTLFAAESSATHPDHVLQFSSDHGLRSDAPPALTLPSNPKATPLHVASFEWSVLVSYNPLTAPIHPPPDAVAVPRWHRSTVLLI
jgi:hypothetical protein